MQGAYTWPKKRCRPCRETWRTSCKSHRLYIDCRLDISLWYFQSLFSIHHYFRFNWIHNLLWMARRVWKLYPSTSWIQTVRRPSSGIPKHGTRVERGCIFISKCCVLESFACVTIFCSFNFDNHICLLLHYKSRHLKIERIATRIRKWLKAKLFCKVQFPHMNIIPLVVIEPYVNGFT